MSNMCVGVVCRGVSCSPSRKKSLTKMVICDIPLIEKTKNPEIDDILCVSKREKPTNIVDISTKPKNAQNTKK